MVDGADVIIHVLEGLAVIAAVVISALTSRRAANKADLDGLQETIMVLQTENKRLSEKVLRLEIVIEERDKRVSMLESNLRDATQGRVERTQYTRQLEAQVEELQSRLGKKP